VKRTTPAPAAADAADARPAQAAGRVDPAKVVRLMLAFFGDSEVPLARPVAADAVPSPYRSLLVHAGHMTEVLERHHGGALSVHPYRIHREGDIYGRRLDLRVAGEKAPVMTGIMVFNLALVAATVREEIVRAASPLGEILIRHRILRRVKPDAFLAFDPRDPLAARFGLPGPLPAYGRLATIDCDGRPAVDLLEIVRP
jgi:chorismate-pyruvate lyase